MFCPEILSFDFVIQTVSYYFLEQLDICCFFTCCYKGVFALGGQEVRALSLVVIIYALSSMIKEDRPKLMYCRSSGR
jgi:hypothetical protein